MTTKQELEIRLNLTEQNLQSQIAENNRLKTKIELLVDNITSTLKQFKS